MGHTSGPVDPVFGQCQVFDCSAAEVNPEVVKYLAHVRDEALHTVGVVPSASNLRKRKIEISYDDEEVVKRPSEGEKAIELPFDMDEVISWFDQVKEDALSEREAFEGYDEETLNTLLVGIRDYISRMSSRDESTNNLIKLLEGVQPVVTNEALELDEKWAAKLVARLGRRKFTTLDNLKLRLNTQLPIPTRAKAWKIHIPINEPSHEFFHRMNSTQLFDLLRYLTDNIVEHYQTDSATDYGQWLVYLLLHLPRQLTANEISEVRGLSKKVRALIIDHEILKLPMLLPSEIEDVSPIPRGVNPLHLALAVVAVIYGQRDILFL
ncbi:ADL325Cp [Eremothecium gossypii ATCC 10895]|uniref:Pre-mRNA-splicing factor BRR1 n=1 Tax=Eremothecium gossypii (strain ATCC 10895 / CBS 109.51 / FGSC 9923 / NRRL Y-1056) TaxID=284811 RepID=BRR1_EREGS|nr:ADL325Cp [Eremothecium gossypii ATCC 10895]Q75B95.1 RecName: Full=Pre-mRNA-splicing factor BRR1 [Eremothecium gossypii ATCC 10895]AAS51595.1 ADL325Cp [Eremothecium gossypii ATCC 10895]